MKHKKCFFFVYLWYNKMGDFMKQIRATFIILVIIIAGIFWYSFYSREKLKKEKIYNENERLAKKAEIQNCYSKYVKTNDLVNLYDANGNIIGKVNDELELDETEIDENTKYFKIKNKDWYIDYKDIKKIDSLTEVDDWYKNYVVFNANAVTKDTTNLYIDGKLTYSINEGVSLPIIIRDDDKYYVEYNNKLMYILKDDATTVDKINTEAKTRTWIRTLAYHAIYDPKTEVCTNIICHTESQFSSHMGYLSENGYFTLKMKDLELFLTGKIRIPEKSAVITIDDGYLGLRAIPILEKYKVHATMFLITNTYKPENFKSDYLELHSHSHGMHVTGVCPGGQGGGIKCLPSATIQEDLKKSSEILGGSKVFCYPFYEYNDYSKQELIKAGYRMAFIGAAGVKGVAYQKQTDLYRIPRYTIASTTTFAEFVNYVK